MSMLLLGRTPCGGLLRLFARSDVEVFMVASSIMFPGCMEAETLEALSCREAISLANDIIATRIRVASGFLNVVRNIEDGTRGSYAHIVEDITALMQDFNELSFCHERRTSNREAHNEEQGRRIWLLNSAQKVMYPCNC
jgi:hypothetical protein